MKIRILKSVFNIIIFSFFVVSFVFAETQDQRKELSLHYYRGVVYFEAGRYDEALTEFQKVSSLNPYYKEVQKYMDGCIKLLDQYRDDVLSSGEEEKLKDKKSFDLYFLGKAYYEKGDYDKALKTFRAVLEKNPQDKFAQYYVNLCRSFLPERVSGRGKLSEAEKRMQNLSELEKEVSLVKSDIREQEDVEKFISQRAERRAVREEVIRAKERQLKEQEQILEEEKQDYLAQAKISKEGERIKKQTEKWRNMKERLSSEQPGVPAELIDYPVCLSRAENYYVEMNEALRTSRWNAAGLNAINSAIDFCDAILIYFYGVRSAAPRHDNITRLLLDNVKRSDTQSSVYHMRAILNLKKIIDDEDRPITRAEALFLSDHAEKIAEWAKSVLP